MTDFTNTLTPLYDHYHEGLVEILGKEDAEKFITSKQLEKNDPQTRGILIQAGRAGFYYWLRHNRRSKGWDSTAFRLHPVKTKIASGLEDICSSLEKEAGVKIYFKNEKSKWQLELLDKNPVLSCSYLWGFVQEFTRWAGIGRFYEVREESCRLNHHACCELIIKKDPQD